MNVPVDFSAQSSRIFSVNWRRKISLTTNRFFIRFIDPFVVNCLKLINKRVNLCKLRNEDVKKSKLYRFFCDVLALILLYTLIEKTLVNLSYYEISSLPYIQRISFIMANIMACNPTTRIREAWVPWSSQRKIPNIWGSMRRWPFDKWRIFSHPPLSSSHSGRWNFGTRAKDNAVKFCQLALRCCRGSRDSVSQIPCSR